MRLVLIYSDECAVDVCISILGFLIHIFSGFCSH